MLTSSSKIAIEKIITFLFTEKITTHWKFFVGLQAWIAFGAEEARIIPPLANCQVNCPACPNCDYVDCSDGPDGHHPVCDYKCGGVEKLISPNPDGTITCPNVAF